MSSQDKRPAAAAGLSGARDGGDSRGGSSDFSDARDGGNAGSDACSGGPSGNNNSGAGGSHGSARAAAPRPRRTLTPRTIALCALLTALALIFSYVEALIPIPVPIPGVKLGVANLVVVIVLYRLNVRYALLVNGVRIVIAGLLFSGVFGMLYSFAGGLLSLLVMALLKRTGRFSMVGVSMAGGVAHNLGQLLTAALLISNLRMLVYFGVLLYSGLASGILIGILATLVDRRLPASGGPLAF